MTESNRLNGVYSVTTSEDGSKIEFTPYRNPDDRARWGRLRERLTELGVSSDESQWNPVSDNALAMLNRQAAIINEQKETIDTLANSEATLRERLTKSSPGYSTGWAPEPWLNRINDTQMVELADCLRTLHRRREGEWVASNAKRALEDISSDNRAKAGEIRRQRVRISELTGDLNVAKSALAEANRKLARFDVDELDEVKRELADARRACKELREQRDAANRGHDEANQQFIEAKSIADSEARARFARREGNLREQLRVKDAKIDKLSKIIRDARDKLDSLQKSEQLTYAIGGFVGPSAVADELRSAAQQWQSGEAPWERG